MLIEEGGFLGGEALIFHVDFKSLRERRERSRPPKRPPRKKETVPERPLRLR